MNVRVYINFNTGKGNTIETITLPELVNVSNAVELHDDLKINNRGFQLSPSRDQIVSKLDGTYTFFPKTKFSGILTREISNVNGIFTTLPAIVLRLRGELPKKLYVTFDHASKEYATRMRLTVGSTSTEMQNTSVSAVMDLPNSGGTEYTDVTLEILSWSRAYSSAKVSRILLDYSAVFTSNQLEDITWSENTLNSAATVNPGIVEQYADISIYDRYNYVRKAYEEGALVDGSRIYIESVDSDGTVVAYDGYIMDNWDISGTDKHVTVTCSDPSKIFDKIYVRNVSVATRSVHDYLTLFFAHINSYTWSYIDTDTEEYCKNITTPNSWVKTGALDEVFHKLCTMAMIRIYWSKNKFVVMRCW